jgi:hypothetical protein
VIWTRQFGTPSTDVALGITAGRRAAIVVGSTSGPLSGEPSLGRVDAFAQKYRIDGRLTWTRLFGTDEKDVALAASMAGDTLVIAGRTGGSFPDENNAGGMDAFLRIFDPAGAGISTLQMGSSSDDEATGVATGVAAGELLLYLAGATEGALPGATSVGREDAFLGQAHL